MSFLCDSSFERGRICVRAGRNGVSTPRSEGDAGLRAGSAGIRLPVPIGTPMPCRFLLYLPLPVRGCLPVASSLLPRDSLFAIRLTPIAGQGWTPNDKWLVSLSFNRDLHPVTFRRLAWSTNAQLPGNLPDGLSLFKMRHRTLVQIQGISRHIAPCGILGCTDLDFPDCFEPSAKDLSGLFRCIDGCGVCRIIETDGICLADRVDSRR